MCDGATGIHNAGLESVVQYVRDGRSATIQQSCCDWAESAITKVASYPKADALVTTFLTRPPRFRYYHRQLALSRIYSESTAPHTGVSGRTTRFRKRRVAPWTDSIVVGCPPRGGDTLSSQRAGETRSQSVRTRNDVYGFEGGYAKGI